MLAPDDVLPALDRWVGVFDEPFGDQAALPTMLLAEYARRSVTVVLTGEGADEVFGGYGNYVKRAARGAAAPRCSARAARRCRGCSAACRRGSRAIASSRRRPSRARAATRRSPTSSTRCCGASISPTRSARAGRRASPTRAEAFYDECDSPEYLDHLLDVDARLWLPDDLLAKVDRATMAFSLEARVPYLDHDFYGWCARLAPALKVHGSARKVLLKQLAERYLPRDIVHRPKQGFMMPLERWLARELQPDITAALGPHGLQRRGLVRPRSDRTAARRARIGPQEPRDAAVGAADPRTLVRALRARFAL